MTNNLIKPGLFFFLSLIVISCQQWEDFTTYFNTYYNSQRLMKEAEDEFEFRDEKKRITPNTYIPEPDIFIPAIPSVGAPPFMRDFVVSEQKRQPVNVKLDSILIKGSKILAKHPKSNYIEGSLYLMAKTFFYKNEWLPSQIKCSELIDRFPTGDLSPDAHLLISKNFLIQRKFLLGKTMLSRTVDIAWLKKRYDILSEAFRLEAELALFENDQEAALRPYKQAIVQTDDNELKARWQVDMASLLYRMGKFSLAEKAFAKVLDYSPDYQAYFEANLYQAACMSRQGKYELAESILDKLESDGKFEEWLGWVVAERINMQRLIRNDYRKVFEQRVAAGLVNLDSLRVADSLAKLASAKEENPTMKRRKTKEEKNKPSGSKNIGLTVFQDDTLKKMNDDLASLQKFADSAFVGNTAVAGANFEQGMDLFKVNDYLEARKYFARARAVPSSVSKTSDLLYNLLNTWDAKRTYSLPLLEKISSGTELNDSTKSLLALSLFELGRVHEQLGNVDSSYYYYGLSVQNAPVKDEKSARYIFAYARIIKTTDPYKSDSLFESIVKNYPRTEYAKESMSILGLTSQFIIDTVAELYSSGVRLRKYGNYSFSIAQFKKIYNIYPKSNYSPKALYAIGWIYEKNLFNYDSALYYYQLLIANYTYSEYSKDVMLSVAYLSAIKKGDIPDSLKPKPTAVYRPMEVKPLRSPFVSDSAGNLKPLRLDQMKPEDMLSKPEDVWNNTKDALSKPVQMQGTNELIQSGKDIINDPSKILNSIKINNLNPLNIFDSEKKKEENKEVKSEENKEENFEENIEQIPDSTRTKPPVE